MILYESSLKSIFLRNLDCSPGFKLKKWETENQNCFLAVQCVRHVLQRPFG